MVCRFIKSTNHLNVSTPVIALTAYEHTFGQYQIFDDVLSKPVSIVVLKQLILAIRSDASSPRGATF